MPSLAAEGCLYLCCEVVVQATAAGRHVLMAEGILMDERCIP